MGSARILVTFSLLLSIIASSDAQTLTPTLTKGEAFWFGAKIGSGVVLNEYWDKDYKDFYNFSSKPTYNVGLVFNYAASDKYGVYTELQYERFYRNLRNDPNAEDILPVESKANYTLISIPVIMRFKLPLTYQWTVFAGIGPKISYWLSGSTDISSDEHEEVGGDLKQNYVFTFDGEVTEDTEPGINIPQPNRFQYGLMLMVGMMFNTQEYQRISVDARLKWAHSFYGFDEGISQPLVSYQETLRFRQHFLSFNMSYTFGYDPIVANKGKSTFKRKKRGKTF